jgi:putative transposase
MRTRCRVLEKEAAHFITSTIVEWLPVFTTAASCDILVASLGFCREHKALQIHAWVILDNHFHAIVSGPDLPHTIQSLKRHTAKALLAELQRDGREWLLHQFAHFRARHKIAAGNDHQVWQEGYHPQAITTDEMMLQKLDYLHRNPVQRGLVASPEHWRYSSAHEWLPGALPVLRCDPWR